MCLTRFYADINSLHLIRNLQYHILLKIYYSGRFCIIVFITYTSLAVL